MNSFQKTFATVSPSVINSNEDDWETVPEKISKKSKKPNLKVESYEPRKALSSCEIDKIPVKSSRAIRPQEPQKASLASCDIDKIQVKSTRPREPRKSPTGIYVNLGPEWKKLVRSFLPNRLAGEKAVRDDTILDEIGKIKRNTQVSNFEFKKIVCMFLHQAIKTDRNTLIERIIKQWESARYNIIELIDSIYDGCRPMTQACWSGSILSIRLIVSADTTGQILSSVHPTKGETILETLAGGRIYAIKNDPASEIFIADKFDKCERYIHDAIASFKRQAAVTEAEKSLGESKQSYDPKIIEEIDLIKSTSSDIVSELSFKLAELFINDNKVAMSEYFGAINTLVDKEIVKQIETSLANEGIDLV
jgi:hypothetical protein